MMNINHFSVAHENDNSDANYATVSQMMPHYNTMMVPTTTTMASHEYVSS